MIKISEFSPSLSISKTTPASAHCNVIVNNHTPTGSNGAQTEVISDVPITQITSGSEDTNKLYEYLAVTFSRILKSNNATLIANLIDQSGKIILDGSSLITAIALLLNMDQSMIRFSYEDPPATCLHKVNPVKSIESIKVDGRDFALAYNREYNTLTDVFGISLKKVLINAVVSYS